MIFLLFVFVLLYQPFQSNAPRAGCNPQRYYAVCVFYFITSFQSNAPHAGCNREKVQKRCNIYYYLFICLFQSNAPRAGCNSKTIQSKRVLVAHKMYGFANYVLYTLKHLPTYCIGTTLQPLIFSAKLLAILC